MPFNLLLILALIGLVAVGFMRRRAGGAYQAVVYALVALALVLSVVRLIKWGNPTPVSLEVPSEFPTALGYMLGREVAKAAPGAGDILVVLAADGKEGTPVERGWEAHIEGVRQGLGEGPYRLVLIAPTAADEEAELSRGVGLTTGFFLRLMRAAPEAKAIVSFLGAPVFDSAGGARLPPMFVFDAFSPEAMRSLMSHGRIRAAILPKFNVDLDAKPRADMTLEEVFDMRYTLLTAP